MTPVTIDMFLFPEIILFLNKLNKDILCIRKQTTFNTLLFTFTLHLILKSYYNVNLMLHLIYSV